MCGITGAVWMTPDAAVDESTLDAMTAELQHRGPDEHSTWIDPDHRDSSGRSMGIGLGFRRLSIIDLAGAHQPLADERARHTDPLVARQSVRCVFNGEIYNFASLRRRLEGTGHHFATEGDGEPIVHLYEDVGTDVFEHLAGMFAIAIWDPGRHQLVLGRDRIGQKPLYYWATPQRLVFASELKSFAKLPDWRGEIDPASIDEFLTYQYVPHPGTIYREVRKVPPGHFIIYRDGQVTVRRYWNFDPSVQREIAPEQAAGRARELLEDAVRLRLQSDVPLGTFLSGGIDSSIITALAAKQSSEKIRTFSIGFREADYDETEYAAEVARHLGTEHRRYEVTPDAIQMLDSLVHHYDEPFGDSSAIPTTYLCEQTRREVTVALSGDGGDELFAGYDRYRALHLSQRLQRIFPVDRLPGLGWLQKLPDSGRRRSVTRRAKRFVEALGQPLCRRYLNWLQIFPETLRGELYRDDFVQRLPGQDPVAFLESAWARSEGRDPVTRASMADVLTYLPCDLCTKVDIASMSHSLEVRQPMLDHRVVEFAAALPVVLKFRGGRGKLLLESAFGDLIPKSIFHRPKMGFGVPIATWFRQSLGELFEADVLGDDARTQAFFRREVVQSLLEDHRTGKQNHAYRLWNLLILERWLRRWGM